MTVNILGVRYRIVETTDERDEFLKECDGYCDKTTKKIVIKLLTRHEPGDVEDFEVFKKKVMRHEIIHAFLFESGLHENWKHDQWGHDETWIDWYAVQFPKIKKAFEQAGCL